MNGKVFIAGCEITEGNLTTTRKNHRLDLSFSWSHFQTSE